MKLKGTSCTALKKYFDECHTPEEREKLKAALAEPARELFERTDVLPFTWIEYGTYVDILLTADKVLGRGDFEIVKQINYFSARHDIKGVYKFIVSLLSPKTALQASSKLFKQFYDKGALSLENLKSNSATMLMKDVADIPLHHDVEQGAYVEEIMRMAGAKEIRYTHPECMARGDARCRWEINWK
jgi:hypothetical protein